jgi:endonuclease/exonuclease/phosphatase family metal-dependent hydrolase
MRRVLLLIFAIALIFSATAIAQKYVGPLQGTLKVLTYNIHHGNPPSRAGLIDLEAIAKIINTEKPDLVALQEVDYLTPRSGNVDQAKAIADMCGMNYKFFKAINYNGGEYGLAILSRFPITESKLSALPQVKKGENRILAYVNIAISSKQNLIFANTHLDAQRVDSNRVLQMNKIVELLKPINTPVIICGDFNSEAGKETINILDANFKRSCIDQCEGTILIGDKSKTIDYVAVKASEWIVSKHKVIDETYASDHKPILVEYKFTIKN